MPSQKKRRSRRLQLLSVTQRIRRQSRLPERFRDNSEEIFSLFEARHQNRHKVSSTSTHKRQRLTATSAPTRINIRHIIQELGISTLMRAEDYRASELDAPHLVHVKPVSLLKGFHGQGLYAQEPISKGTILGEYTGAEFTRDEFQAHLAKSPEANPDYAMEFEEKIIDAQVCGNFTRYINYSDAQANVAFQEGQVKRQKTVVVRATKDIYPDQQLLVDYNTYDERASKDYFFLNPEDGWLSTAELYSKHARQYKKIHTEYTLAYFGLDARTPLYSTRIGRFVLNGMKLSEHIASADETIHLPYLTLNEHQRILDATETDLFTPLMAACFLGQIDNVQWLVEQGANINQQQNHSGKCPLFIALEGYHQRVSTRPIYLQLLEHLIRMGANISVHDRADKTFLHQALSLPAEDFQRLLCTIETYSTLKSHELMQFLDDNDFDVVMTCIRQKQYHHLTAILTVYPDYFSDAFEDVSEEDFKYNVAQFQKALKDYSVPEKRQLLRHLDGTSLASNEPLLAELNLPIQSVRRAAIAHF